jgi:D-glycerate 3-kinase
MARDGSTGPGYAPAVVGATLDALLATLCARADAGRPWLAGLSGLPGSGKSTFAHQLAAAASARGVPTLVLGLDDFYLGHRARQRLARRVHPLLATRGVPGTHDLDLLEAVLAGLAGAGRRPLALPRFDKGRDTRLPRARWTRLASPPRLVLLEGWCVGVASSAAAAGARPLNALERREDREGRWRAFVEAQLAGPYASLWSRLGMLVVLQAPGWHVVRAWRAGQERERLARGAPAALDGPALARFLMHYERLGRRALATLPAQAEAVLALRRDRSVRRLLRMPRSAR